ncbi:MAG: SIS domain-containing protein [Candidatus Nanopelagicaceae bacterium]|jgi:glucosamine--fructose-6-phosphate aminotransferase (isomerizing)
MAELGEVMMREINEIPSVLAALNKSFTKEHSAIKKLRNLDFHSVIILARGTSDNAAHFLKYLIEVNLGLPCGLASPSAATLYQTDFNYRNTLVIALSQSGQSTDLLTFANAAKAGGGFLLSITNNPESPLAKLSDQHIYIQAGAEVAVPATKSYVAQLLASYLLVNHLKNLPIRTEEIIESVLSVNDKAGEILNFAEQLDVASPLYILGRGYSYPNAKEFALKLQETCLIPVQGMSTSDFLHGPIASLTSNSQVVFISPEHTPDSAFGEAPELVRSKTAKVSWLGKGASNIGGEAVISAGNSFSEVEASIGDAILFQKVTHKVATKLGLNPDKPQGLNKVTITR